MGYLSDTGMVVLELSLVSGSAEDRKSCKAHPDFCLLLDPKLVGHFEMRWAPGRAATAYTVEGAVKPGEWVVLAQAEGPLRESRSSGSKTPRLRPRHGGPRR